MKVRLPSLGELFVASFDRTGYEQQDLPIGMTLYRYGTSAEQATTTRLNWLFLTTARFENSQAAIENCALLDFVIDDRKSFPRSQSTPPRPWNTATFRAQFRLRQGIPAYVGWAAPITFDVYEGKLFRGPGDLYAHQYRSGGAVQVLVHRSFFASLQMVSGPSLLAPSNLMQ
jgi:hypothetical protein